MNTLDQPSVTFRPAAFLAGSPGVWAGHLPFASDLIAALKPKVIVELGVYFGDSYFGFCQAVAESNLPCTCYGVDTWRGDSQGETDDVYDALTRHNDRHYRSFSHLLRSTFDEAIAQFSNESINLLHIGRSKTYEAAQHVFEAWFPKVRPGGVILLHDIAVRSGDFGIWRIWEDLQKRFPSFAFRNNNGLGVLWKPARPEGKNAYLRELFSSSIENQERIRRYYSLCAVRLELEHKLGVSRNNDAGLSLVQVVCGRQANYKPDDRLTRMLQSGKWVNVFLRLEDGLGDGPLLINPTNRPAVVDIESIFLRKLGGQTLWSWRPTESTDVFRVEGSAYRMPSGESLRILCFGNNPQVFLPKLIDVPPDEPLEVEIRMRVDLELGAVQQLAAKSKDLQKERANWAAEQRLAIEKIEREHAKHVPLGKDRERELIRNNEDAKLALRREHEQTKQILIQQHEEAQKVLVDQFEKLRKDLEKRLAQAEELLEQHRKTQMASIAERDRLHASQSLLGQEISISRGNVDDLKAEVEQLSINQAQLQHDLLEARKRNSQIAASLEQERILRATIENSWWWQLSKPFRSMSGLFRPTARE